MRVCCLQHVPFEGPAHIESWARAAGHDLFTARVFAGELPRPDDFDWLIILGGPMNVYEETAYPWLVGAKRLIETAIAGGKIVLGICLGAQLIAAVLGAPVRRNSHLEIGWYPVTLTPEAAASPAFSVLPPTFTAFHWHGDTFDIPAGAVRTAASEACANQAFDYQGRVFGWQFHLESSLASVEALIDNCGDELTGPFVQSRARLPSAGSVAAANSLMEIFFDNMGKF